MSLVYFRKKILDLFEIKNLIENSLVEPQPHVWQQLEEYVPQWWTFYKDWEADDTVAKAYNEQRLTVKGIEVDDSKRDKVYKGDLGAAEKRGATWVEKQTFEKPPNTSGDKFYQFRRGLQGIVDRVNPKVFKPEGGGASQKYELGLHDLSAALMNNEKPISQQQFKTPSDNQIYVFMPLSEAGDQAVFQYINTLAKAYRDKHQQFYNLVRDIRSKMTRIKLAAEHDMGTTLVCVGRTSDNRPKFRLRPAEKTTVSILDQLPNVPGQKA